MTHPRILLVDDQRQVSRMFRASLEASGREYVVVEVLSGEEALLELSRGPVDLLVTDLRLPGISGLELLEKVRQLNPKARAIMITGHPTEEARARAEELGVIAFLQKPIGTSIFLEAVRRALELASDTGTPVEVPEERRPHLEARLAALQRELGATATLLLDSDARLIAASGQVGGLELDEILGALVSAFSAGLKVSSLLGSLLPANFQYFDGDTHHLYLTNVGAYFGLVIAYDARQEAAQKMGAVVHYGRRGAEDLLNLLSEYGRAVEAELQVKPFVEDELPELMPEASDPALDNAVQGLDKDEAERFWDEAASGPLAAVDSEGEGLTYEQARRLGLLDDEDTG